MEQLNSAVRASLQLPPPGAVKGSFGSSLMSDLLWDKQLGLLLLSGVSVFPFSRSCLSPDLARESDRGSVCDPECLKSLLEAMAILEPEDVDFETGIYCID